MQTITSDKIEEMLLDNLLETQAFFISIGALLRNNSGEQAECLLESASNILEFVRNSPIFKNCNFPILSDAQFKGVCDRFKNNTVTNLRQE